MLVVTGASGLLGASVLRSALDLGWEAIGLCHQHVIRDPAIHIASVDLTDDSSTRTLLLDLRPEVIVHCAAATNVDWCEDNPRQAEAINVQASATLAEIACTLNARLMYISTDAVFDGGKGGYVETDEPAPLNVYARSKLAGEREALRRRPPAIVARVNIYGWNAQDKHSLAEWVLRELEQGRQVPGFTDVFFTPILVNHLVPVLFDMLQHELSGLYHIAGSERTSKFEFARRVAAAFGFDPARVTACRVKDMNLKAARPLDVSLNTGKIEKALGRAMPGVDSGLREFRELRERQYPRQLKSYLGGGKQP
ncbi:MAG: SDR family oxidoreductase [Candidatus Sulfotelmatobacter sp.]